MTEDLGIWLVRSEGKQIGLALQAELGGELLQPWLNTASSQKDQFIAAYPRCRQWIVVGATGIAVRFLDGLVHDKHSDPAVVVVDEAGRHAISLLAGHEGGANRLAYRVANVLGASPVITTATEALKPLVVGIGCRKGVAAERIEKAVLQALGERRINEVREIATVDLKAKEAGLIEFCDQHALPLRIFSHATIAARPWVSRPSEWVRENIGLDGVCEPCALLACLRGRLLVPKTTLNGVAVAVVEDKVLQ